jgi:hypothetical protein
VVQVIGLGMPAGREICRQRTVDESGYGDGVGPAGVPLQGEWHELAGRHRADDGVGVGGGQGHTSVPWFVVPVSLISMLSSKLYHYAYPFVPPLAIAAGYAVMVLSQDASAEWRLFHRTQRLTQRVGRRT